MSVPFNAGEVLCTGETEKAIAIVIDGQEEWIPKSQIHDDSEVWQRGQEGDLVVSEWMAKQKGWL